MNERVQMPSHRTNQSDGFVINDEAQEFLNKGAIIIRMRGLPYECTPRQVIDFFQEGDQSCEVYDGEDGILFVKKPDGKSTGDAFVQFLNESEAAKALSKHKELIGPRYIELFRSTPGEVEQVLRKSQETRPRVPAQQSPLVAPLPTPQIALPQRIITSGTRRDCIRLRGLPYEATVEHILDFLGTNHSKNIIFQGVHMVYKAHGQPSGEAFIQMNSEASAAQAASQCHYNKMHCGKKVRYVEVFQCSGDDMNAILNSGHLSAKTTVMNPTGIDNNIPGMGLPLAPTMLPYYEPSHIPMMPFIQNPFFLNQLALQQQNALAASLMNKSPQKPLYQMAPTTYAQWSAEMDPYKPLTTTSTTTTDSLTKPKMTEAEMLPPQQDFYSTYGTQPGVYYLPRVIHNPMFTKPGFPTVQAPVIFPQVTQTLPPMGVLGVKRSWEQAFPLETTAAVQGAKRWQTPQVANFPTPGFFPDVGTSLIGLPLPVYTIYYPPHPVLDNNFYTQTVVPVIPPKWHLDHPGVFYQQLSYQSGNSQEVDYAVA